MLPGFASGGSFTVGGSGGIDSQLVAFNATPGEHVSVSKNGSSSGASGVNVIINSSPVFNNGTPEVEARMKAFTVQAMRQAVKEAKLGVAKTSFGYSLG